MTWTYYHPIGPWISKRFNLEYTGFDLTLRSAIENDCYRYTRDQEVNS